MRRIRGLLARLSRRRAAPVAAAITVAAAGVSVLVLSAQEPQELEDSPFLRIDPERTVMSERDSRTPCGECHESEYEVWRQTPHATGFDSLHRTESARDILSELDLIVTKRQESLCMRCHYTVGPELQAIAGVSCESCHGPARDWLDIHNDWGEGVDHPDQESPEHRAERIAESEAAGMLRPSGDPYAVLANCFECHTVPREELVNVGRHRSGSSNFDVVARIDQIRHNFLPEQWGEGEGNEPIPPERARLLFLLGRTLNYEYTIRGLAEATTEDGSYFRSMHRRTVQAQSGLEDVARTVDVPAVAEILEIGEGLRLAPNNREELTAAADRIREVGRAFARAEDRPDLSPLDPLIDGESPPPVASAPEPEGSAPAGGAAGAAAASGQDATGAGADASAAEAEEPSGPQLPELPGEIRTRPAWFDQPGRAYTGQDGDCLSCHAEADEWWYENPHDGEHARLTRADPRAVEIATLYGIGPRAMANADQICMNCHGTILNASIAVEVGCQSCHGPAADYFEPHQDGGNPQLGMRALKDPEQRAANCARCHHVTDRRLLAAGHPSGAGYDFVAANAAIEHFPDRRVDRRRDGDYPRPGDAALGDAWASATGGRAVPQVQVAELPASPQPSQAAQPAEAAGAAARRPVDVSGAGQPRVPSTAPRRPAAAVAPRPGAANIRLDLEPLPERADTLTTEELLLIVKRRLERVYTAVRGGTQ